MFKPSSDQVTQALDITARTTPCSVGYRIVLKPLHSSNKLKAGEAEAAPTLAALGFESQSSKQTERETRGSDMAIICHIADGAFTGKVGDWGLAEGDVVVFNRYAGHRVEIPPGSGDVYHFCNDEDVLGKYEESV